MMAKVFPSLGNVLGMFCQSRHYTFHKEPSSRSGGVLVRAHCNYLPSGATGYIVLCVLWICLNLYLVGAVGATHRKSPDPRAVVHSNLLLLGIESHAFPNEVIAASAPDIEWHFESYDKDPLIQFLCPLSERVLAPELQMQRS